jgi:hypothetical protein
LPSCVLTVPTIICTRLRLQTAVIDGLPSFFFSGIGIEQRELPTPNLCDFLP